GSLAQAERACASPPCARSRTHPLSLLLLSTASLPILAAGFFVLAALRYILGWGCGPPQHGNNQGCHDRVAQFPHKIALLFGDSAPNPTREGAPEPRAIPSISSGTSSISLAFPPRGHIVLPFS